MRGLLTIAAISFALWSVTLTSNHFRVRRFLWCHLFATFCVEAYDAMGWDLSASGPYYWVYVLTAVPILVTALLIARKMVLSLRHADRWRWVVVSALVAAVGVATSPLNTPTRAFLAVQGAVLALAGTQCLTVALLRQQAPYTILGGLWCVQSICFYMYAKGLTLNVGNWNAIGDWLPAAIVCAGMTWLGLSYFRARNLELEA